VNPRENVGEGYIAYVAVARDDAILRRKDLTKKLVVLDEEGLPHLRLDRDGRCLSLQGAVGRSVSCRIYAYRPAACRRVEAGSDLCLRYRRDQGIDRLA
jgi:Fe-S-cluster containining protein